MCNQYNNRPAGKTFQNVNISIYSEIRVIARMSEYFACVLNFSIVKS